MPTSPLPYRSQTEIDQRISEFIDYMQVERGASPLTIRNYKHYLRRFSLWFLKEGPQAVLSNITPEQVRHYRVWLASQEDRKGGTLSRKTQGYHAIALRSFLRWLLKQDIEVMSPDKIDLPKSSDRQVKFLNEEQVGRLLNAPSLATIQGKRDKAILEVLFSTGLRVSELAKLDRDKVDLDRREFGVVGKGGKGRVVFLSERATHWLGIYLRARTDHYSPMFIRHHGTENILIDDDARLTVRSIQRLIKKYALKVKIPVDVTPHVMRHSFATDLLIAGADLRSVQEMLGHKNVGTTQIYTHVTHKHLREVHEQFHGRRE